MVNVSSLRHPKEQMYFGMAAATGGSIWLIILLLSGGSLLVIFLFGALFAWLAQQFFKATVFGNAVRVSNQQYPKVWEIAQGCAQELNLSKIPFIFVANGNGLINAFAMRLVGGSYVLLMGNLVDLMLKQGHYGELHMIIGHELGHHAAGHVAIWKNLLIWPAKLVPFLGTAYSRACEFTADRIGQALTRDDKSALNALVNLASGCEALAHETQMQAFLQQESLIPPFFGFLNEIFSTHPRMTRRIMALTEAQPVTTPTESSPAAA